MKKSRKQKLNHPQVAKREATATGSTLLRWLMQRVSGISLPRRCWNVIRANALLAVMASIASVVAGIVGVASYMHTANVDEREGKLDGQLLLAVADDGPPLSQDEPTYFFFSMPRDAEDARYLVPVHLNVQNTANVKDGQVNLALGYDRDNFRRLIPAEVIKNEGRRPKEELSYQVSSGNEQDIVKYKIAFLSPHDSQSFSDGAFATRMMPDPNAPMIFNSGVGLDVSITTYSERDTRRQWNVRYRGLRAPDDAGIQQVMKDWYAKQLAFEIRRNSGFWGYIPKLIFQKEVTMYGYSPDFRFIPNLNTFVPTKMPNAYAYRVKPYSWKLLFHLT